jgi:hypothetical protein
MEQPSRRPPAGGWHSDRARSERRRGPARSRTSLLVGIGLPAVLALGALAAYPTIASSGASKGPASGQTILMAAANGTPGGQAPVVQQQNGLMLDPRGKRPAAVAAKQQAAMAKAAQAATPAQAAVPNPNCTIIVPARPLTAQGLMTPYQLTATDAAAGPCNEANVNQTAFVQAAIISPAGQITLYDPLVIDKGTQPLVAPVPVTVPAGSTVGIWFGFNGTQLTLANPQGANALRQGRCVNGIANSIFGQFAACNGTNFMKAGQAAIANNQLVVPPIGTALDGKPCPTVRDFSLVDQDQSDNVTAHILAAANGQTGQNTAAVRAAIQGMGAQVVDLANGSDNRLLSVFVDPTLGCTPWMLPNVSNDNMPTPSLPLNELQANQQQQAPVALIPLNDPMASVNATPNPNKVNAFRMEVGQLPLGNTAGTDDGNGANYCNNLFFNAAGIQRVFADMNILVNGTSPNPAAATNLFTFLAMRASDAFMDGNLGCMAQTGKANPITLTVNGNNVVTAATFTPPAAAANNANPAAANPAAANPAAANPAAANPAAANPAAANPAAANPAAANPAAANPAAANPAAANPAAANPAQMAPAAQMGTTTHHHHKAAAVPAA